MNMKLSQLIAFLLTLGVVSSACLPETQLSNLESGILLSNLGSLNASATSNMLQLNSDGLSQYTYQFKSQFTVQPQIAFSRYSIIKVSISSMEIQLEALLLGSMPILQLQG